MSELYGRIYRADRVEPPRHDVKRTQSILKKFPNHVDRLARLSIEGRLRHSVAVKDQRNCRGQRHA